ncbi:(p)ppGpp synthetase [Achromobacter xylosoxidans]
MNVPIDATSHEAVLIDSLVTHYRENELGRAERLADALLRLANDSKLRPHVHSVKMRAKDPEHLRDKLNRKLAQCKTAGNPFDIDKDNLFAKINDLAGVRILHLHTSQFPTIDQILKGLLRSEEYEIIEGPRARVWDTEYTGIFERYGIETESNPRLYTSVHYIISTGNREVRTAEIQVRTLAEELWGEVDHTLNYPHPNSVPTCQEQIKVLARVTSSCTRLVDSIFMARDREMAGKKAE